MLFMNYTLNYNLLKKIWHSKSIVKKNLQFKTHVCAKTNKHYKNYNLLFSSDDYYFT
jgi:hypothetical protein